MAGNINLSGRGDLLWPFTVSYCHNLLLRHTLFELYLVLRIKKKNIRTGVKMLSFVIIQLFVLFEVRTTYLLEFGPLKRVKFAD